MTPSRHSAAVVLAALALALAAAPTAPAAVSTTAPLPQPPAKAARTCDSLPPTIMGTPHDDVLRGTDGLDVIVGRDGDDRILGLGGEDQICSGRGDDHVTVSGGWLAAGDGNDLVSVRSPRVATRFSYLDLGRGRDEMEVLTEDVPAGLNWTGFTGRDLLRMAPIGGSTSDYELSFGPNIGHGRQGIITSPYFGGLGGFDDYIGTASTGAQLVTGSRKPNVITVSGDGSTVWGRGGDDTLRAEGLDTAADGGDGTDTCVGFVITINCEN